MKAVILKSAVMKPWQTSFVEFVMLPMIYSACRIQLFRKTGGIARRGVS